MADENQNQRPKVNIVERKKKSKDVVGAILLISVGAILLLNNLDILSWAVWSSLWKLWPLFLILGGFQAIFHGSKLAEWAIFFVGMTVVAIVTFWAISNNNDLQQQMENKFNWWPRVENPSGLRLHWRSY